MNRLFVAALAATFAAWTHGAAVAAPADIQIVQLQPTPSLPAGPPVQYRPVKAAPFELRTSGVPQGVRLYGTASIDQLDANRLRVTHTATRMRPEFWTTTSQEVSLVDFVYSRIEVDPSGKYLLIEPPSDENHPTGRNQFGASMLRLMANSYAKDWANLFDQYEGLPKYQAGLAVGTPTLPTTLNELFNKRVEVLEAMIRGNASGFWTDLPKGGTMTPAQRDILLGTILARAMPETYEGDVRIRGSVTQNGRTYLVASGTVKRSVRGRAVSTTTVEQQIDPANGLVVSSRTNGPTSGGGLNVSPGLAGSPSDLSPLRAPSFAVARIGEKG
jgi:hypothetical protein